MRTFIVRDAATADFEAIAELTADVYTGEGFSPADAAPKLRDVAKRVAASETIVAADKSTAAILGAVCLAYSGELIQIARRDEAELRLLAVTPQARNRGVGEALVRECLGRAHRGGAAAVVLSTQPSMIAAQRLYARLGFTRDPSRDWQTSDGRSMHAHTMRLLDSHESD